MRKIPTPKSLGLTKTTCNGLYNSMITRGGKIWFEVEYKGAVWYSNGYIAIDRLPNFKGYANITEFVGVPEKRLDLEEAINSSEKPGLYRPVQLAYGIESMSGDVDVVRLVGDGGGIYSAVQTKYYELLKWLYPTSTIKARSGETIHRVEVDGELVAAVMPYRV